MNYFTIIVQHLQTYRVTPSEDIYKAIEEAMAKYKENPPDIVRENMTKGSALRLENPDYKRLPWEEDELTNLFSRFINCPTNVTYEAFLSSLRKHKEDFLTNPKTDPFT